MVYFYEVRLRIFKSKIFDTWSQDIGLTNNHIKCVALELKNGLITARLGANLIKQRIGLYGRGKSSSVRAIIAFEEGIKIVFLVGFAKNVKDNINKKELAILKRYTKTLLNLDDLSIEKLIKTKELIEVI